MGLESEYANCKTLYVLPPAGYDTQESNVPVMVRIGRSAGKYRDDTSDVFEKLGASYLKMAVSLDDGVTECPVEVTEWDVDRQLGILFVKIPSVPTTGMTLKLWYDSTHADNTTNVGAIGSAVGQSVWANGFAGVWHMKVIPVTKKTLYAGEVSESAIGGSTANALVTFDPIDCTGLTKGNGWLKIDLKCDLPENLTGNSQLEITSAGRFDTQEWTLLNVHGTYGISTEWRTYYFPLSSTGTSGSELNPAQINYIRWYVLMADGAPTTTISWRNAEIVSTADLPNGTNIPILLDSTQNQNHGMIYGATEVDGPLGRCLSFDGVDDCVTVANDPSLTPATALTAEIYQVSRSLPATDGIGNNRRAYMNIFSARSGQRGWFLNQYKSYNGLTVSPTLTPFTGDQFLSGGIASVDEDSYIAATFEAAAQIEHYREGIPDGAHITNIPTEIAQSNRPLYIGFMEDTGQYLHADVYFAAVSSVARSPAWIALINASLKDELIAFSTPETESLTGNERMRLKPNGTLIANEFVEV